MAKNGGAGTPKTEKKKSGIPTGNAGEYFVMGELLRQGYDAQLADRNTSNYDLLVGLAKDKELRKVQVKTVRAPPWYVKTRDFTEDAVAEITIYVMIGAEDSTKPVRYFVAKNHDLAEHIKCPPGWKNNGFMALKAVLPFEDQWRILSS